MTLQQLTYFLAALEHGSFTAAAASCTWPSRRCRSRSAGSRPSSARRSSSRAGRGLEPTEAGRLLRPQAERTLAAAQQAADSVREIRELTGGTATFGTFGNAPCYLLADLVEAFRTRYPNVRVRLVGQNSSEVADAVRDGRIEAGLIVLPIDDPGLDVRADASTTRCSTSGRPRARARADDDRAARRGAADPLRRALRLATTRRAASSPSAPSAAGVRSSR